MRNSPTALRDSRFVWIDTTDAQGSSFAYQPLRYQMPEKQVAASPVRIDKTMPDWNAVLAPANETVISPEIFPVEESLVNIVMSYLHSILPNFFSHFGRLFMWMVEIIKSIFKRTVESSPTPEEFVKEEEKEKVQVSAVDVIRVQAQPNQAKAAVVVASSSPVKGGPKDEVWMDFWRKKLNPEEPGHQKYLSDLAEIYSSSPVGSDWRIFFDDVEKDKSSPWQIVINRANLQVAQQETQAPEKTIFDRWWEAQRRFFRSTFEHFFN